MQIRKDCNCKCGSFCWIGSCTEFIKKYKRTVVHILQERYDIRHV